MVATDALVMAAPPSDCTTASPPITRRRTDAFRVQFAAALRRRVGGRQAAARRGPGRGEHRRGLGHRHGGRAAASRHHPGGPGCAAHTVPAPRTGHRRQRGRSQRRRHHEPPRLRGRREAARPADEDAHGLVRLRGRRARGDGRRARPATDKALRKAGLTIDDIGSSRSTRRSPSRCSPSSTTTASPRTPRTSTPGAARSPSGTRSLRRAAGRPVRHHDDVHRPRPGGTVIWENPNFARARHGRRPDDDHHPDRPADRAQRRRGRHPLVRQARAAAVRWHARPRHARQRQGLQAPVDPRPAHHARAVRRARHAARSGLRREHPGGRDHRQGVLLRRRRRPVAGGSAPFARGRPRARRPGTRDAPQALRPRCAVVRLRETASRSVVGSRSPCTAPTACSPRRRRASGCRGLPRHHPRLGGPRCSPPDRSREGAPRHRGEPAQEQPAHGRQGRRRELGIGDALIPSRPHEGQARERTRHAREGRLGHRGQGGAPAGGLEDRRRPEVALPCARPRRRSEVGLARRPLRRRGRRPRRPARRGPVRRVDVRVRPRAEAREEARRRSRGRRGEEDHEGRRPRRRADGVAVRAAVRRRLGVPVVITDVDQARVDAGVARIAGEVEKLREKGRISPDDANRITALVSGSVSYDAFADADWA
ncbi:hypothetical protein Pfo_031629 [Paulownia fortunei]|nr:hypothetical protein Pfo_031629 [Paulownia fortunei]